MKKKKNKVNLRGKGNKGKARRNGEDSTGYATRAQSNLATSETTEFVVPGVSRCARRFVSRFRLGDDNI